MTGCILEKRHLKVHWIRSSFFTLLYVFLFIVSTLLPTEKLECAMTVNYRDRETMESRLYWESNGEYIREDSLDCIIENGVAVYELSKGILDNTHSLKFKVFEGKESATVEGLKLECRGVSLVTMDGERLVAYVTGTEGVKGIQQQNGCMEITAADKNVYLFFDENLLEIFRTRIVLFLLCEKAILTAVLWFFIVVFIKKRTVIYRMLKAGERDKLCLHHWIVYFASVLFFIGAVLIYTISSFLIEKFNGLSVEEIIFHLKVPLKGTSGSVIGEYWNYSYKQIFVFAVIFLVFVGVLYFQKRIRNNLVTNMGILLCTILAFGGSIGCFLAHMDMMEYIEQQLTASTFIEENYVNPQGEVQISFPSGKRNLVYIYLESMESTFASKEVGGAMDVNLIPELTELAQNHINFSADELVGGADTPEGAGWTIGAMVAHSTGLPLLIPIDENSYGKHSSFLPGAVSIGEILENAGYKQEIMVGSEMDFGGRELFYEQHGNYEIWDYNTAIETGKISPDYNVWWGFEDEKLYSFAKEEILRLADGEEPFNFTLLTVDTHATGGYLCERCPDERESQYENTLLCASAQVYEFVKWMQEQDFYKDTTIVIVGDHLTMDNSYISEYYDGSTKRSIYNCFINAQGTATYAKNRQFNSFDFFPTTLAAIGAEIEGNRLGLGTNLFSGEKTLSELYGENVMNEELKKTSVFYRNYILTE